MRFLRPEFLPWALALPPLKGSLMLHVVTSGRCWLEVEGTPSRLLQPGSLALVPRGEGHQMASEPGLAGAKLFELPREQVSERYEILQLGGGGAPTTATSAGGAFGAVISLKRVWPSTGIWQVSMRKPCESSR